MSNKLINSETKQILYEYQYNILHNFTRFCCKSCQNSNVKILLKTEAYIEKSISLEKILNFTEEFNFFKEVTILDEEIIKLFEFKSHENLIYNCFS